MTTNYFKSNLKYLLKQKGWTHGTLAKRIDKHRTSVSAYVNGPSLPDLNVAMEIAAIFDITLNDITGKDLRNASYSLQEDSLIVNEPEPKEGAKETSNFEESFKLMVKSVVDETNQELVKKIDYIYKMMQKMELEKLLTLDPDEVKDRPVEQ